MSAQTEKDTKRREIIQLKEIPPLPLIGQEILQAINDDDVSIETMAKIIEQDPGLTARIVSLANSSFFANINEISSVQEAIVRNLGLDLVKSLAFSMIMSGVFNLNKCPYFNIEKYWKVAMLTATLSQQLGRHLNSEIKSRNQLYLGGMLHNLGLLLLVHSYPEQMNEILNKHQNGPPTTLIALEEANLSITHHETASWLAKKWGLPSVLTHIVSYRADAHYDGADRELVQTVRFCANWAKALVDDMAFRPEPTSTLLPLGIDETAISSVTDFYSTRIDNLFETASRMGG